MDRDSHSSSPSALVIVLLPDPGVSNQKPTFGESGDVTVLGLGLARRTALAARRAGYNQRMALEPVWTDIAKEAAPCVAELRRQMADAGY